MERNKESETKYQQLHSTWIDAFGFPRQLAHDLCLSNIGDGHEIMRF
jgi:hypothetical protein